MSWLNHCVAASKQHDSRPRTANPANASRVVAGSTASDHCPEIIYSQLYGRSRSLVLRLLSNPVHTHAYLFWQHSLSTSDKILVELLIEVPEELRGYTHRLGSNYRRPR